MTVSSQDTDDIMLVGLPIWVSTLSSHWKGKIFINEWKVDLSLWKYTGYKIYRSYLKWTMKMYFNPARRTGNILPVVLCAPALDKRHPDGAHLGQFIDRLKPMVHGLGQQGCKLLVIEYLEAATRRYFANGSWVEPGIYIDNYNYILDPKYVYLPMMVVTVPRLYKYGTIRQTFSIDFSTNIVKVNSCNIIIFVC